MAAAIDLTGREIGRWRVLRRDRTKIGRGLYWICECSCGAKRSIIGQSLREGRSLQCRSCSGIGKQNTKPVYTVGDKVGRWTIRGGPRKCDGLYPVKCECGRIGLAGVGNLRNGTSTQCGSCRSVESERRKKQS